MILPASVTGCPATTPPRGAARPSGDDETEVLILAARTLLTGLPKAGVTRLAGVGAEGPSRSRQMSGSSILRSSRPALNPLGLAHAEALEICRSEGGTIDWSYLSPVRAGNLVHSSDQRGCSLTVRP